MLCISASLMRLLNWIFLFSVSGVFFYVFKIF
nr:MAG TPA: hypothetical protein [Bacteriophage sp.]